MAGCASSYLAQPESPQPLALKKANDMCARFSSAVAASIYKWGSIEVTEASRL